METLRTTLNVLSISCLLMLLTHINIVQSRRIPLQGSDDVAEFNLGNNKNLFEKVPLLSRVYIRCELANPIWYKNDAKINVEVRRPNVLKFDKFRKTDAATYTCQSADNDGQSTKITLHVGPNGDTAQPHFADSFQTYSQVVKEDEDANNGDSSYGHHDLSDDQDDDHPRKDNSLNSSDMAEAEFAPKFKDSLKVLVSKPSGSYAKIVCAATGNPTPNITWTKNNETISRSMGAVLYKKWSMNMEDSIPEDSGSYMCLLCNIHGCINHTTRLLVTDRVNHKPIVLTAPQNLTLKLNESANMKCEFLSDLHSIIAWTFKACKNYICPSNATIIKGDPENINILTLQNVTFEDEGWYTCIAANSLGKSNSSAYLKVVEELEDNTVTHTSIRNQPVWITVVSVVVLFAFLIGTIFILFVLRKLKHEKLMKHRMETVHQWTKKVIIYKPSADPSSPETMIMPIIKIEKQRTTLVQNSNSDPAPFSEYEFPLDSTWEIPRNQLSLSATLGEGAFGRVVMAEAHGVCKGSGSCIVAVKMVKEGHTDADMASLVREMEVMKMIGKHINIINLLGCCSQDGPLYVIVEYAPHGNLKDFLKKNRPTSAYDSTLYEDQGRENLTQKHMISFAFQVARGMEYLASRRCIHRDLAARNVLVSDDYVIKIADFGLARDIQDTDYYRKNTNGRLPIKWMAPESLQDKFYDTQSDVWSYGVLLWEIMTYGEQPYMHIMSAEQLYNYLMSGQRMEKPPRCSLNIYMLMRQCWNFDAHARPNFTEIVENLDKILSATANANEEYLDLAITLLETPPSSDDESDTDTMHETSLLRYNYK